MNPSGPIWVARKEAPKACCGLPDSRAGVMVRATDAGALALRSELTAGPVGAGLLEQLCRHGRDLQTERETLATQLNTSTTLDAAELRTHANVLSKAGALAWVTAPFRNAKRAYLGMSQRPDFDKDEAARSLLALAKWKDGGRLGTSYAAG